jgi:uncharacterized membrane protein YqjE
MAEPEASSSGLFSSLRKLCDSVLAAAQNRVELFAVELREEKCRAVEILLWASGAMFLSMMALTTVTLTIIISYWETAKVPALIGVSVFYVATASVAFLGLRKRLKGPLPFDDTITELKKDREWFGTRK